MNPLTFESPPVRLQPASLLLIGRLGPDASGDSGISLFRNGNVYQGSSDVTTVGGGVTTVPFNGPNRPIFVNAPATNEIIWWRARFVSASGGSGWSYYNDYAWDTWAPLSTVSGSYISIGCSATSFVGSLYYVLDFSLAGSTDAFRSIEIENRITA